RLIDLPRGPRNGGLSIANLAQVSDVHRDYSHPSHSVQLTHSGHGSHSASGTGRLSKCARSPSVGTSRNHGIVFATERNKYVTDRRHGSVLSSWAALGDQLLGSCQLPPAADMSLHWVSSESCQFQT